MEDCTLLFKDLAVIGVEYVLWGHFFTQNQIHISYTETLPAGIAT